MLNRSTSLPVVRNAMKLIASGAASDAFETLGISNDDFNLVVSDAPWIGADRRRVRAVLESLVHGTLDVVGLPRIEVPAEYQAAVLATFVSPGNLMLACRWSEDRAGPSAENVQAGGSMEPVTAEELFALGIMAFDDVGPIASAWSKRVNRAVDNAKYAEDAEKAA